MSLRLLMRVREVAMAHRMIVQQLIFGMEVEGLRLFGRVLLLLLLWPVLFIVQFGCDFLVDLGDNQVVCKVVGFLVLDGPGDFFLEHGVHWWDDLDRHVDQALGEDEADRRGFGLRQQVFQGL